jgi:tetrapyrrole methylase family protein / MazG family protein
MSTITILGLGPGDATLLTREAWDTLQQTQVLYLRTAIHPTVAELPGHLELRAFDTLYEVAGVFGDIYERIAAELIERATAGEQVAYAVPGHPLVAEATTRRLLALAREHAIPVRIVAGLSFVEPVCAALALDPLEHGLQLVDALDLVPHRLDSSESKGEAFAPTQPHVRPGGAAANALPPADDARHDPGAAWSEIQGVGPYRPPLLPFPITTTRPALICQVYNRRVASEAKLSLLERYPSSHPVTLVRAAGVAGEERVWSVPLHELDHQGGLDHLTCAYLPPLAALSDLRGPDGVGYVVARLLGPAGCPWDREQTHQSIRKDLLEEVYEALEALDAGDMDALAEELGDVLLHVLMHSEMARQAGEFDLGDVYQHIGAKLIRRHPHVFGPYEATGEFQIPSPQPPAASVADVLKNWDAIKQVERAQKGQAARGLLDGIPPGLPALMAAQETIRKAAKAGFDSDDQQWAWDKLHEEIDEIRAAAYHEPYANAAVRADRVEEEFGDMLLAAAKLAFGLKIDSESALRVATAKFRGRFAAMERRLQAQGHDFTAMSTAEKEALWRQAKDDKMTG